MNIDYSIKNFRIFDEQGACFAIRPITILTGANSSGKSSLVKSILLLKKYIDEIKGEELNPSAYRLSFSDEGININGINAVFNRKGQSKELVFSYSISPVSPNVKNIIEYTFSSQKDDILNEGWLTRLRCFCEIDEKSDLFLDISFDDNGDEIVNAINLTGNIQRSFLRELEIATYRCAQEFLNPKLYVVDRYPSEDEFNELNKQLPLLENEISNNELNKSMALFKDDPVLCCKGISYVFHILSGGVEIEALKMFKLHKILLYLPILEEIGTFSPEQLNEFFKKDQFDCEQIDPIVYQLMVQSELSDLDGLFKRVVDSFSQSGYDTFIEYYRCLESQALNDFWDFSKHPWTDDINKQPYYDLYKSLIYRLNNIFAPELNGGSAKELFHLNSIDDLRIDHFDVNFYLVYTVLSYFQRKICNTGKVKSYFEGVPQNEYSRTKGVSWSYRPDCPLAIPVSDIFIAFASYIVLTVKHLVNCNEIAHIKQVDSFLCPVLRSYSIYNKDNPLSTLLVENYSLSYDADRFDYGSYIPGTFINRWIKQLGLGRCVKLDLDNTRTSFIISIIDEGNRKHSLADLGHGVTQIVSLLLHIENQILYKSRRQDYGGMRTICFQEPEISLHPKLQSMLADIMIDAYKQHEIHFIVETHSEYLIRKLQTYVAISQKDSGKGLGIEDLSVYYLDDPDEKQREAFTPQVRKIEIAEDGRFKNPFGKGFFDEADSLAFELLTLKLS